MLTVANSGFVKILFYLRVNDNSMLFYGYDFNAANIERKSANYSIIYAIRGLSLLATM